MSSRRTRRVLAAGEQIGPYSVVALLGQGGYGDIYSVKKEGSDKLYAMKTESLTAEKRGLEAETQFFEALQDSPLFPHLIEKGASATHRYIVMDLYGPSVSGTRRQMQSHCFSVGTVLKLGIFMLECLRSFHEHGFVHRDVKPGNFLLRNGSPNPLVMIDFGLSRRYIDPATQRPFPERKRCGFRGTAKYSSVSAQKFRDQSPRDDMISWLYSLVELVDGRLPWGAERDSSWIMREKQRYSISELTHNLPREVREIWKYVERLTYTSRVNYSFVTCLLRRAIDKCGVKLDDPFDWEGLSPHRVAQYSPIPVLPCAVDYVNAYPNIELVDDVEDDSAHEKCQGCAVM